MANNSSVEVQVMIGGSPAEGKMVTLKKQGGGEYGVSKTNRRGIAIFTNVPAKTDLVASWDNNKSQTFRAGETGIINKK